MGLVEFDRSQPLTRFCAEEPKNVLRIDNTLFADWAHLPGATRLVGSDLVVTCDASNTITLKSITLVSFTSADAVFVGP